jgi:TRAP-type C4-dicarboxylate transport system permease small subunit
MAAFRKVLAAIGLVELWIALVAFVFVVVLTMIQVGYRYLLAGSIWWAQEISQLAMLIAYFLGIAYVYKAKNDIIVGFLLKRLSRDAQVFFALIGQIMVAAFCFLLVITGLELAPSQLVFFTYILNIPRFYSTLPLIVGSASMGVTAIYYAIVAWDSRHARTSQETEEHERVNMIVVGPEVVI